MIRTHKNQSKSILKVYPCNRNKTDHRLDDKMHILLYKYNIKREVFLE